MRDTGVFNIKRALPRMSWSPKNLYNLWARTAGHKSEEIRFTRTSSSLFQQRWKSKAMVRAYHGDYINEKIFKRWYLPETLPDVRPRRKILGDDTTALQEFAKRKQKEKDLEIEEEQKGMAPVGSLMFAEVERRIDVFIFRCCFAHSVYEARRLVIHGDVMLNGKKHQNANTRLAPGDMVSVNPSAIRFFKPQTAEYDDVNGYDTLKSQSESTSTSELATTPKSSATTSTSEPATTPEPVSSSESTTTKSELAAAPEATSSDAPNSKDVVATTNQPKPPSLTPFYLPTYASPWIFIPAYIEPSFSTCSAIYVRHPTARPGYSEIPTPYDADGEVVRFAWEWYVKRRPRVRSKSQLARMPEDRALATMEDVMEGRRLLRKDIKAMARKLK
ncbi:hypothetical protein BD779DRAFT_1627589 [Infundibulicybe gibba]|nr:hypothetical protein BD779DRAFT_1627589 [Infundibulicybe gibba]